VSEAPDTPVVPDTLPSPRERIAELLHIHESLRQNLRAINESNMAMRQRLTDAMAGMKTDRERQRAAAGVVDDAIRATSESARVNEEVTRSIAERERAEAALRDAEAQLRAAQERFRRLSDEFDHRIRERTSDLHQREARLRSLATQIKRVEQRERQRLARLLHDHVQQLLVAAKMRIECVANDVGDRPRKALDHVLTVLTDAISATRDLSVQLTPPLLHDQGLPAALQWLVSRTAGEHNLQITTLIDDEANPETDEERDILFHAALEFLLNAAKHAKTPHVALELAKTDQRIRLKVCDRGAGFDMNQSGGGRSFGLFQLRQRLESVGGSLTIQAAPGHGTCASATLYFVVEPEGRAPAVADPPADATPQVHPPGVITVVLVDDHQIVREGISQILSREPDINVVGEAADGREGVEIVTRTQPRVVVMDVNMPGVNGIDATRLIRAKLPDVKVIGLSLEQTLEVHQMMLEAGAVGYLTKDGAADHLVQAIRDAVTGLSRV
jgi:signal transduction histidine kinase/ActR/RegA family two-component response regulator